MDKSKKIKQLIHCKCPIDCPEHPAGFIRESREMYLLLKELQWLYRSGGTLAFIKIMEQIDELAERLENDNKEKKHK